VVTHVTPCYLPDVSFSIKVVSKPKENTSKFIQKQNKFYEILKYFINFAFGFGNK